MPALHLQYAGYPKSLMLHGFNINDAGCYRNATLVALNYENSHFEKFDCFRVVI